MSTQEVTLNVGRCHLTEKVPIWERVFRGCPYGPVTPLCFRDEGIELVLIGVEDSKDFLTDSEDNIGTKTNKEGDGLG